MNGFPQKVGWDDEENDCLTYLNWFLSQSCDKLPIFTRFGLLDLPVLLLNHFWGTCPGRDFVKTNKCSLKRTEIIIITFYNF